MAQTVTEWTFNSSPADAAPTTGTLSPSVGTGSIAAVGAITGVSPAVFQAGSATDTSSPGDNSALQTSAYPAQSTGSGTAGVRFNASTAGASNINVSFEQRHSNTASRFFRFEYTTDGTNFITTGLPSNGEYSITVGSTFTAFNFDLSTIAGVSNNPNFGFRVLAIFDPANNTTYTGTAGTYGTGGTVRFDLVRVVQGAPPVGACCVNGFCVGDLSESACLANGTGSSWGGAGTTCGTFVCPVPTGSCCVTGNTTCNITDQATCAGTWTVNGSCTPNPCDPAAACCFPASGVCLIRPSVDCANLGGTYNTGVLTCSTTVCPVNPGACCTGATCATATDPIACYNSGGQFKGYGTTCSPNPCFVATGTVITTFDFDTNIVGAPAANLSYTANPNLPTGTFSNAFDLFGVVDRTVNVDVADDSLAAADTVGILRSTETGKVFGVEDLLNGDNAPGTGTATFTFNVAGFSNLSLSVDCAAFGNFEGIGVGAGSVADVFNFTASIDGGTPANVIVSSIYEGLLPTYTLESGATNTTTNDPAAMNGALILNRFVTIQAPITGSGNTLTITFNASSDGGGEVFLFDNIVIRGTAAGGNGACCSGATCSATSAAACTGPFTEFQGVGTVCNAPGNNTTPCCKADFNQSGAVTVQDIFDFLGGYFSSSPQADINGGGTTVQDIFDYLAAYFTGCA